MPFQCIIDRISAVDSCKRMQSHVAEMAIAADGRYGQLSPKVVASVYINDSWWRHRSWRVVPFFRGICQPPTPCNCFRSCLNIATPFQGGGVRGRVKGWIRIGPKTLTGWYQDRGKTMTGLDAQQGHYILIICNTITVIWGDYKSKGGWMDGLSWCLQGASQVKSRMNIVDRKEMTKRSSSQ